VSHGGWPDAKLLELAPEPKASLSTRIALTLSPPHRKRRRKLTEPFDGPQDLGEDERTMPLPAQCHESLRGNLELAAGTPVFVEEAGVDRGLAKPGDSAGIRSRALPPRGLDSLTRSRARR